MNRIKQLREQNNLTQIDLAQTLNVSSRAIGYWESGERDLSTDTIILIAKYFSCTTDYLLGLTNDPKLQIDPNDEHSYVVYYAKGKNVDAKKLKHLIDALVSQHEDK